MWGQDIECIMPESIQKSFCFSAEEIKAPRTQILIKHVSIGMIGKKGLVREDEMKDRAHDEAMAELYHKDPALAVEILNSILEDGNQAELMIALRQIAKAFGGVAKVAEQAHLNQTQLYRTLSPTGNPAFSSLSAILKAMGMRLSVQPIQESVVDS
jgi:probable addiction module antidote protein